MLLSLGHSWNAVFGESESFVGDHLSLDSESGTIDDDTVSVDDVDHDCDFAGQWAEVDVNDSAEANENLFILLRELYKI